MKIYEIIEMLCKEKGITITQMCKEANVSRGSMTDLKMGRSTTLSLPTTTKLCDYFNVSTDFLLGKQDIILDFFSGSGTTAHAAYLYSLNEKLPSNKLFYFFCF